MVKYKRHFLRQRRIVQGGNWWVLRKIGGVPVDRKKNNNLVARAISDFKKKRELTLLITPEGTRKKVHKFKSGFYVIALNANVPIIPVVFDYSNKAIRILPTYFVKGNNESEIEIEEIRQLFVGFEGKIRQNSLT